MARITLILSVITAIIALLGGFRWALNEWRLWRQRRRIVGMVLMMVLLASSAEAANHFIRDGGSASTTGTGSCNSGGSGSWATANACDGLPATLVRGDTYYVASGTYATKNLNTAASGTSVITIKGATSADHGGGGSWLDAYSVDIRDGGSQAIWTGNFDITTSYHVFDGSVHGATSAAAPWNLTKTSYGFKMGTTVTAYATVISIFNLSINISTVTLANIVATAPDAISNGPGVCLSATYFVGTDNSTHSIDYVTIQHVLIDNFENGVWATEGAAGAFPHDHWIFERSISQNGFSDEGCHGEDLNNNYGDMRHWTIRYNLFRNRPGGTGTIIAGLNDDVGTYYIYGNVFDAQTGSNGNAIGAVHNSGTIKAYNNTFTRLGNNSSDATVWISGGTESAGVNFLLGEITNNLMYDIVAPANAEIQGNYLGSSPLTNAYFTPVNQIPSGTSNYTAAGNPFMDRTNGDYRITSGVASAMTAGTTLVNETVGGILQTYDTDILGTTRGADGKWDRGALEYAPASSNGLAFFLRDIAILVSPWVSLAVGISSLLFKRSVRMFMAHVGKLTARLTVLSFSYARYQTISLAEKYVQRRLR